MVHPSSPHLISGQSGGQTISAPPLAPPPHPNPPRSFLLILALMHSPPLGAHRSGIAFDHGSSCSLSPAHA